MDKEPLGFHELFSTSDDLTLCNELKYMCGEEKDDCLPFDEIIAKAKPANDFVTQDLLCQEVVVQKSNINQRLQ